MAKNTPFEDELNKVLLKYNLPTSYEYDKDAIYNLIKTDKKANGNMLNIIIVEELGKGYIKPINIKEIKERI